MRRASIARIDGAQGRQLARFDSESRRRMGEDGASYKLDYRGYETAPSTASQTAWALLGLMAVGEVDHAAVDAASAYLVQNQGNHGLWNEQRYTATGFPRVFYLRYHGYPRFFPLWAMARYRNLRSGNSRTVSFGM